MYLAKITRARRIAQRAPPLRNASTLNPKQRKCINFLHIDHRPQKNGHLLTFGNHLANELTDCAYLIPGWCLMEDLLIKAATLVAVGLATFSSFPGTAQQQDSAPQQQQQPSGQQIPPVAPTATPQHPGQPGSDALTSPAAAQLKPVSAELVDKLDSKSAKQGDSVVVKTDENLQISEGTEIPRGSKLIGHVTNVQPRGDGHENSQIAIQFDRAELKSGQSLPIESVIQSVAPAAGSEGTSGISNPPATYGDATASSSVPTGSMGSMGAPAGSASASASGSMGPTAGAGSSATGSMNQNTTNTRPDLASNSTMQPAGATDQSAAQSAATNAAAPGSIVARNGNVAIRTTSVPGVLLANDIHGLPFSNASGLLLGARRDVHLDGGTRLVLAVAMAPQSNGSGMSR